jgi:hypothetical protein
MSLKKFGKSDVIRNAMRAYPHSRFFIYASTVYYDQKPIESGSFSDDILSSSGGISLFEYNVDKNGTTTIGSSYDRFSGELVITSGSTGLNPPIIPYVVGRLAANERQYIKASPRSRTLVEGPSGRYEITSSGPMQDVADAVARGIAGGNIYFTGSSYPMSASITRELMETAGARTYFGPPFFGPPSRRSSVPTYRHYYGLRNSLDFYATRSPHYAVSSSNWNKDEQDINLISIPKIFYGSRIKHGSMSLKFYITGTLVGELQDTKYNGELIQVGPEGSNGSGSVAGVVMYEEGFVLLTGSWGLSEPISLKSGSADVSGSWLYFGAGAKDGVRNETGNVSASYGSASFDMSFKGHTETQVLTMYAHARRGEVNYSNNPTFLEYGQTKTFLSSSKLYIENDSQVIKNTVSSSYNGFDAPFERQVYISRVAIYDEEKKLIGVATLSNPILKKEAQDLSFKLKLDI